jgi:hypothetical protein
MARGSEIKGKGEKAEVRSQTSEVGVRKKSRQSDKRGENKRLGAKSRINGNSGLKSDPNSSIATRRTTSGGGTPSRASIS